MNYPKYTLSLFQFNLSFSIKHKVIKKTYLVLFSILINLHFGYTQSLYSEVYQILNDNCTSCHNNTSTQGGLNLEGIGNTLEEKQSSVYNNIVNTASNNTYAFASGYQTIYPGRPDKSFLFRKINQGLDPSISLPIDAGDTMPSDNSLTDIEKEIIRQWILVGAPLSNNEVDLPSGYIEAIPDILEEYYNVNGVASFPDGPPPAPDPSEGFQVKIGPFFLNRAGENFSEIELFQKIETDLQLNQEIIIYEAFYSNYSHHFNIMDIVDPLFALDLKHGFRSSSISANKYRVIFSSQYSGYYPLPEGTGIRLDNNSILDLNSHYANYSSANIYKAEVYINIYTQPYGTAIQELHYGFGANTDIPIPNNGNIITHTHELFGVGDVYVWALTAHTHKLGVDYKIYLRNTDGTKGEMIYDGSCSAGGIPGCVSPYFDYSHLPIRFFDPFLKINLEQGIIHEAKWINNGPEPVNWGLTTEDEMMVFAAYFAWDTTGLNFNTTPIKEISNPPSIKVYPNPMQHSTTIEIPENFYKSNFTMFNPLGQVVLNLSNISSESLTIFKGNLSSGLYLFSIEDKNRKLITGKIFIE